VEIRLALWHWLVALWLLVLEIVLALFGAWRLALDFTGLFGPKALNSGITRI